MIFSDRFKLIMLFMMSTMAYGQSQIYSTPGSYNWVVPPCVTQVTVQVWGGGGGGGAVWSRFSPTDNSSFSAEACTAAGGGGGGGFASRTYTVVPGDNYTIVVGAGGLGGIVNASGNNRANAGSVGGNSTFSGPATVAPGILSGNGGAGGGAANFLRSNCNGGCWINHEGVNGAGGNGGTGQNGTANFSGGAGRTGVHAGNTEDRSGAGGGGAGTTQNGSNATATGNTGTGGGAGGTLEGGAGAGGIKQPYGSGYLGTNGLNGNTLGGGGGGACGHNRQASSSSHRSNIGGNGARGEVRILYTSPSLLEPTFTAVSPICAGETLSALPTTSNNSINGTWSPALNNSSTTTYVFTPDPSGPCADTASLRIVVNAATTPTFTAVSPICAGGTLLPLPTTSNNAITGTWSPTINNTATTDYIFTPTAGQCATTATMTITVNSPTTPIFTAVNPICSGDVLSPLPTTSNNAISGTWSPAINNTATTDYTFTPTAGQCATTASMTITVGSTATVPTFTQVPAICSGGSFTLPIISNNSINGTWSPAINNTATTDYTFTPTAGQCATTAFMTVTVDPQITPTFTQVPAICSGGSFTLPNTSNNGYTGTWSPAINNTATTPYTFTPNAGQCATTTTMTVTVGAPVEPTFAQVPAICTGGSFTLPNISNNGYTGTWSPTINNTATTDYTFTPTAGQCATSTTLTVTVNLLPVVDAGNYTSVCSNAASISLVGSPAGGTFSGIGVTGNNFSPAQGTQTVTYTYTDGNGCTNSDNTLITIFNLPNISAGNEIDICEGESVTLSGSGGVSYVWDNGAVNGQTFTPTVGQATYTVTGTDANGCVNTDNITVTVSEMPYAEAIPDVTTGSSGLIVNFENNSSVTTNYFWDFGNGTNTTTTTLISTSSTYNDPGTYTVILSASNGVCTDYDTVQIVIINNEPTIEVPNVFTPNDDASNDQFFIDAKFTSNIKYIIVNRWGNLMFEADGINPLWDGTSNGKPVEEGVYFYKYEVLGINGETYTGHGNVTLIRD